MSVLRVVPTSGPSDVFADARDGGRVLRATWHGEDGVVVLSIWRENRCVATTRLRPTDAARLVALLTEGLASAAEEATGSTERTTGRTTDEKDIG